MPQLVIRNITPGYLTNLLSRAFGDAHPAHEEGNGTEALVEVGEWTDEMQAFVADLKNQGFPVAIEQRGAVVLRPYSGMTGAQSDTHWTADLAEFWQAEAAGLRAEGYDSVAAVYEQCAGDLQQTAVE